MRSVLDGDTSDHSKLKQSETEPKARFDDCISPLNQATKNANKSLKVGGSEAAHLGAAPAEREAAGATVQSAELVQMRSMMAAMQQQMASMASITNPTDYHPQSHPIRAKPCPPPWACIA